MPRRALRFWLPLAVIAAGLALVPVVALTETSVETRLKQAAGLPHRCLPDTQDEPGWRAEASMPVDTDEPRAVTVGGKVYLAGGIASIDYPEKELTGPSAQARVPVTSMKTFRRFDPTSGRYETLAPMPEALNHIGLVADGDDIYVVGGHGNRLYGGDVRNSLFRYSVAEDRWTRLADMPTARGALAVGAIDGKLYAPGGMTSGRPLGHAVRTLEVYDIARDRWSRGPDMPTAREHAGGTVLDGHLYVLGGRDARTDALGTVTRFDPESGEWEALPPLRVAAGGLEAVNEDGAVFALGGGDDRGGTVTGAVQRFEPSEDRWRVVSRMRTPRHGFAATVVGPRIYTFGGSPCALFAASKLTESFDPGEAG